MLTIDQLESIFQDTDPSTLDDFVEPLNKVFTWYGITSQLRQCHFLAQVGHESGEFKARIENLNYSEQALLRVFKKYFTPALAKQYARKPQAIANRVYANRMGNGPEESGDGWRFRGRGLIQITGKNNYTALAKSLKEPDLEKLARYLETPEGATVSAGWYWHVNKLNTLADADDVEAVTRRINGGTNGLDHRIQLLEEAKSVLRV